MGKNKTEFLSTAMRHPDMNHVGFISLISQSQNTVFQARNHVHTANSYEQRLTDNLCKVIPSLVISAHLDAAYTY